MSENLNNKISQIFEKMAVLCELNGENIFKVRAYQKASNIIANLEKDVSKMSDEELVLIRGIGKGIASHIKEIKEKGSFDEFEKLKSKYPPGLLELIEIRGLGAKRVKILYEKLHVDSVSKLLQFAKEGKIRNLEGFGEKIEKAIIESIEKDFSLPKRFLYHFAKKTAIEVIKYMQKNGYKIVEYAGSLRRKKETIGDIDLLCVGDSKAIDIFCKYPLISKVVSKGEVKASVILENGIQCDFRVFKKDEFGAALCYFTGSKQHNIRLRELANRKNLVLNEYGLFKNYGSKEKIAGEDEEDIYKKIGLQYIPPELREDMGEVEVAVENRIPELVELKDIKSDIHCHTSYTDGVNSIEEILKYLSKRYDWAFIGDHSVPLNFVHGLDFEKYLSSKKELEEISKRYKKSFGRSIELEVLKDGSFPFKEDELEQVSLIISALHTSLKLPKETQTERIIKVITSPYCDVVAHLSQRLLLERDEIDIDYDRVFEVASKNNVVFEVNGQPDRLDLSDVNIRKVKSLGLKVVLTSDAHSLEQFDFIEYALNNARRAGLTKNDILNSLPYKDFVDFIKSNRERRKK